MISCRLFFSPEQICSMESAHIFPLSLLCGTSRQHFQCQISSWLLDESPSTTSNIHHKFLWKARDLPVQNIKITFAMELLKECFWRHRRFFTSSFSFCDLWFCTLKHSSSFDKWRWWKLLFATKLLYAYLASNKNNVYILCKIQSSVVREMFPITAADAVLTYTLFLSWFNYLYCLTSLPPKKIDARIIQTHNTHRDVVSRALWSLTLSGAIKSPLILGSQASFMKNLYTKYTKRN